jgi:NitT/TauT family transport system permease protein
VDREEVGVTAPTTRTRRQIPATALRVTAWLVVLLAWQIIASQVDPRFFATPTAIARAFVDLLTAGALHAALANSARSLVFGFGMAMLVGVTVGVLMGRYRLVGAFLDPYVNALFPTPRISFLPLVVLWFGLGLQGKVVVVFMMSVFPILINTYVGARDVSRSLEEVGRSFCATERTILVRIFLPATLPFITSGVRLGLGQAIGGMAVAEILLAFEGLGALIRSYARSFRPDYLFATILVLVLLGVGLTLLLQLAERRLSRWKPIDGAVN